MEDNKFKFALTYDIDIFSIFEHYFLDSYEIDLSM